MLSKETRLRAITKILNAAPRIIPWATDDQLFAVACELGIFLDFTEEDINKCL